MTTSEVEILPVPTDLNFHYFPPSLAKKYGVYPFKISLKGLDSSSDEDTKWQPDQRSYESRINQVGCEPPRALPAKWPSRLKSAFTWKGQDLDDPSVYTHTLTSTELLEIDFALVNVKERKIEYPALCKHNFILPSLGPVLQRLSFDLHNGKGFFVLRGLQPSKYSREDNIIIYLGLSSWVGPRRGRVNPRGDMISHIVQAPQEQAEKWLVGPAFGNAAQPFHADIGTDILALYYLSTAAKGGRTKLASTWTIYNELVNSRPEALVELASQEWVHNTFGHYPPFYKRPLLFVEDGKPILNFSRRVITGNDASPRDPRAPPVTPAQLDAMDAVHFTAEKHSLSLEQHAGDMLFVNNFALLHSREAFENGDDDDQHRHLLRLWLRNDDLGWKIPDGLKLEWENLFESANEIQEQWNPRPPFLNPNHAVPGTSKCG